ncbi:MAG: hypothetical protein HN981_02660 [Candidatus Pacebacteria bacterium]|jgi:hypothetical protein|nr:hypothetical protein [Candidatus Paceibacterota bacterium]MBT4652607.1 hypothetical protein [Candidatus Paceibacterota bacterium]MBT6756434.1 hypothetical protein [Candidatus Paceibacterota bacterium]MBT6921272.1 hypothetical protein [Candidatus Paceibacterota bacterium]
MSYFILITRLLISLFFNFSIFFLEKFFINKKFLWLNGSLSVFAALFFLVTLFSKTFSPPEHPASLPISFEKATFLENQEIKRLFITTEEATKILETNESILEKQEFLPQSYVINMAVLSQVTKQYKKADYYFKTARYIDPNMDIFQ